MAHVVAITLTDAQFDAVALGAQGPGTAEDRVLAYLQGQVDAVAQQHVDREAGNAFAAKGLPRNLGAIGLAPDQIALVVADADEKIAAAALLTPE